MISFVIPGLPIAKQRPRVTFKAGRALTYTPGKTKGFERDVWWHAKQACPSPLPGLLRLDVRFHGARGDADNLLKSVMDGMQGACFKDDRQVIELHVYVQRNGEPRTEVELRQVAA